MDKGTLCRIAGKVDFSSGSANRPTAPQGFVKVCDTAAGRVDGRNCSELHAGKAMRVEPVGFHHVFEPCAFDDAGVFERYEDLSVGIPFGEANQAWKVHVIIMIVRQNDHIDLWQVLQLNPRLNESFRPEGWNRRNATGEYGICEQPAFSDAHKEG